VGILTGLGSSPLAHVPLFYDSVRPTPSNFRRPRRGHPTTRSQAKFAIVLEGSRCTDPRVHVQPIRTFTLGRHAQPVILRLTPKTPDPR
jgi:hypothetical protein